ncbi:hypothetical protein KPL76_05275 [Subtercola sp. PAMC28395]|uniref:hypothetical protein n=1 Tax=Subtercola sp. PAMC28395 TaxID=2846775 RepID=UPI001C0C9A05|nr:hypothetical protein [Subtercola sp. PAMC28395]QWT24779.1 hypothetical protein KPL76_05275 [Subtercola sp. PAMC28395]
MKVILNAVSMGGGQNLGTTSLAYESGGITLAVVETYQRPTVLSLLAAGRMAPDAGTIVLDGQPDPAILRAITAVVDAPDVSEHVHDLTFASVVEEELMFASLPTGRRAALDALAALDAAEYASWRLQNVPVVVRLRVLAELAASRPGIRGLVLTSPDRHGGDPFEWWAVAVDLARRDLAILVIVNQASADVLSEVSGQFEADRQAEIARREAAALEAAAESARRAAELESTVIASHSSASSMHPTAAPTPATAGPDTLVVSEPSNAGSLPATGDTATRPPLAPLPDPKERA